MFASALLVGRTAAAGQPTDDDWPRYGRHGGGQRFPESAQHTASNGRRPAPSKAGKSGIAVTGQTRPSSAGSVTTVPTLRNGWAPPNAPGGRETWAPGSTGPQEEGKLDNRWTGGTPMQRDGNLGRGLLPFGTGHSSTPLPDSARPVDNPDTSPRIALDPASGKRHVGLERAAGGSPALLSRRGHFAGAARSAACSPNDRGNRAGEPAWPGRGARRH